MFGQLSSFDAFASSHSSTNVPDFCPHPAGASAHSLPSPQRLIRQVARQGASSALALPSSHSSVPSTKPLPHDSMWHSALHPSPPRTLPSSHPSTPARTNPSPQNGRRQVARQASLSVSLPSSQASRPGQRIPSPQRAAVQALVQSSSLSALPSSHASVPSFRKPSPQPLSRMQAMKLEGHPPSRQASHSKRVWDGSQSAGQRSVSQTVNGSKRARAAGDDARKHSAWLSPPARTQLASAAQVASS